MPPARHTTSSTVRIEQSTAAAISRVGSPTATRRQISASSFSRSHLRLPCLRRICCHLRLWVPIPARGDVAMTG